jgi:hypothetical protein
MLKGVMKGKHYTAASSLQQVPLQTLQPAHMSPSTSSTGTSSTSPNTSASQNIPSGSNVGNSTLPQGGNTHPTSPLPLSEPYFVIFGIKDMQNYDNIENIEMSNIDKDRAFFKELKARYKKHRHILLRIFSPFRFRHCKFVEVSPQHMRYQQAVRLTDPSSKSSTKTASTAKAKACPTPPALTLKHTTTSATNTTRDHPKPNSPS